MLSLLPSLSDYSSKLNLSMTLMDTIVGFQSGHDVSYCLLKNGKPIIHEELERFSRVKEELGDGLKFFFENSSKELQKKSKFFTLGNFGGRDKKKWPKCNDPNSQSLMNLIIDNNQGKYFELSHHMCHAANAFFSSNFDKSLIVTIDGGGLEEKDILTASTIYMGEGTKIEKIKVYDFYKFNMAVCWNFVTQIFGLSIGFPKGNQAGTVMAMASMSNSTKYVEPLMDMMTKKRDIQSYFLDYKKTGKRIFNKLQFSEKEKFDIASSLQIASENLVKEELNFFVKKFKPKKLCVAGGCALNSVLIGKIQNWFPQIENVYVPPVPYDSGLAIGSAQFLWHQILGNKRIKWKDNFTPYLGRKYNENDIKKALYKFKDFITFYKDDDEKVLKHLDDQKIVSVFGGGSESGRRALGNRSIIADPRNEKMKEIINKKVKHRQWFRPFAPSILKEKVTDWFERDVSSPYMTHVIKWKKDKRKLVPAVVHFDGSARLQTVTENDNFWYYNFINKWEKKTGVPIILNTSFNDSEPIVESPEDAIRCFLKTNIDHLYFFDYQILVSKK